MGRICHLITLIICLCALFPTTGSAQDSNFVRKSIAILSSPELWGRGGPHGGELKAAQYIRTQLTEAGAKPLTEDGFQHYEFAAHKMEGQVACSLNGKLLSPFWDYRIAPYAHTTHIKDAPVVRVDASTLLDAKKLLKFYDRNAPLIRNGFLYIDAVSWRNKKVTDKEVKELIQGLMFNNPFQSKGILIGVDELPIWGLNYTDEERNYAFIYVKRSILTKDMQTISVDFDNTYYTKKTQNVCFKIEGTQHPDSMIVLTAHYDHLGCMGDSVIFPGAHDNGSGTSAVIDFARHFAKIPPAYTTVFLLFSGEESGLRGSRYFVENTLIDLNKVKLVINLDMFCGGEEGFTVVNYNSEGTQSFYDNLVKINEEQHLVAKVNPRVNTANSDHYFFSQHCPAIFIYTMGGRYGGYHHFTDTCENCGLECYNNIFSLLLQAIRKL